MEPLAFALFSAALAAPFQGRLERRMPASVALLVTVIVTLSVLGILVLAIVCSIGEIGNWVIANIASFEARYAELRVWLEARDVFIPSIFAQRFEIGWVTGPLRSGVASLQTVITFIMLAFVFIVLGLKAADALPARIFRIQGDNASWDAVATGHVFFAKFRRYMGVRTVAGVLTGSATAGLAALSAATSRWRGGCWYSPSTSCRSSGR